MKKPILITVLVLVGVTAIGISVAWAAHPMGMDCHRHMPLAFIARKLDLNATQQAQIKTMWEAERPIVAGLVREFSAEQKAMNTATAGGQFDQAKVQEVANQEAATLGKLMIEKEKLTSNIYSQVLTADQRIKADQWREHFPAHLEQLAEHLASNSH